MSHKVWKNNFIEHREGDASKIVDSSRFDQISLFLKLQMFNGDESNLVQYFEIKFICLKGSNITSTQKNNPGKYLRLYLWSCQKSVTRTKKNSN